MMADSLATAHGGRPVFIFSVFISVEASLFPTNIEEKMETGREERSAPRRGRGGGDKNKNTGLLSAVSPSCG